VVDIPGVQNSAEVKDVLGKVATLQYPHGRSARRCTLQGPAADRREASTDEGRPEDPAEARHQIVTGDQLINAPRRRARKVRRSTSLSTARVAMKMMRTTKANLGKPMGGCVIEQRTENVEIDGQDGAA